jgi:phosphoglycerate dehydrogenase-like enzyme
MPNPRVHALVTAELTGEARIHLADVVALTDGDALRCGRPVGENELIAALAGKEILVVGYEQVTAAVIDGSPDLRLIASMRGGPEANIAIGAATARGIPVLYTTGRNARAVAEHTVGLMLALARHIPRADALVREHVLTHDAVDTPTTDVLWRLPPRSPAARAHETLIGSELYGKTLGVVGCGAVGRLVARFGDAFGMRVLVHDPFITDAMGSCGEKAPFAAVLADSDYLTPHARLTPYSAGMIGAAELAAMKPTACLINTARRSRGRASIDRGPANAQGRGCGAGRLPPRAAASRLPPDRPGPSHPDAPSRGLDPRGADAPFGDRGPRSPPVPRRRDTPRTPRQSHRAGTGRVRGTRGRLLGALAGHV